VECSAIGVSVQEYRARISTFIRSKLPNSSRDDGQRRENNLKLWFSGLIPVPFLVRGEVEVNPGPFSIKEEAEIFEFIKKTEKSGAELKTFMEALDKNLAAINLVITRKTAKMEEGNKTM
jgi:hypothetical protein